MAVFVVIRVGKPEAVKAALEAKFAGEFLQLQADEWLVSASMTAKQLSEAIGITDDGDGSISNAIVAKISSYYGRASTEIWDFIQTKFESKD